MNILVCVIPLCALIIAQVYSHDIFSTEFEKCNFEENVIQDYQTDQYDFTGELYKNIGPNSVSNNFVFFPISAWVIFGAIAETADPVVKLNLLKFLHLPQDPCTRLKYYQLASSRFVSSDDINITSKRALVVDTAVTVNPTFQNFVSQYSLLDIVSAPMRSDPHAALEEIRRVTSALVPNLDLSGNSVLLDAVDYNGLWSTAFEDAVVEKSPFYSSTGEQIGTVDLMRVKRRVRIAHFEPLNIKCIEVPVGHNGRLRMVFAIVLDSSANRAVGLVTGKIISDFLKSLKESYEPIDIAIPRFNLTSEFNLRDILKDSEIKNLWTDPTVTKYISDPAALPSGYVYRSTISFDTAGLEPAPVVNRPPYIPSDLDPSLVQNFVANKPFLMGLFDAETYTCLMAAAYTKPT